MSTTTPKEITLKDNARNYCFKIKAKHSNKYLDVLGQATGNEANVGQWEYDNLDNQKWLLVPVSAQDGKTEYYHIINKHSGKFLDVLGQATNNGANVGQWEYDNLDNQKWQLIPIGETELYIFKIKAKHSGKFLDVLGQATSNGANVGQWEEDDLDNQRWILEISDNLNIPKPLESEQLPSAPPKLTSHHAPKPSDESDFVGRALLPFYLVDDPSYDDAWKLKYSPYYILDREVKYVSEENWFQYNGSTRDVTLEFAVIEGWEKSESESFSHTTSISFGTEGAIFSSEVSYEFGYSSEQSFTESGEKTHTRTYTVAPGKSVAVWTAESVFTLRRADQSVVKNWRRNGGWYVDEFPDESTPSGLG